MSRVHAAFPPTAHPLPDHIQMTGEEFISFCLDLTNSNSQWGTIENIQSCSITRANEDPKLKKRRYCLNLLSTFIVLLLIILICLRLRLQILQELRNLSKLTVIMIKKLNVNSIAICISIDHPIF